LPFPHVFSDPYSDTPVNEVLRIVTVTLG
jgi:hypothetical protein